MMTRAAQIVDLEAKFKSQMVEIYLLLRDDSIPQEKKERMKSRLTQLENVLLSELDEVKGNTEVRRKKLQDEVETKARRIS